MTNKPPYQVEILLGVDSSCDGYVLDFKEPRLNDKPDEIMWLEHEVESCGRTTEELGIRLPQTLKPGLYLFKGRMEMLWGGAFGEEPIGPDFIGEFIALHTHELE